MRAELQVARKKKKKKGKEEIKCFPSTLPPKKNLMPLIFRIVKGRNNDFLFGMHFSASLVEC